MSTVQKYSMTKKGIYSMYLCIYVRVCVMCVCSFRHMLCKHMHAKEWKNIYAQVRVHVIVTCVCKIMHWWINILQKALEKVFFKKTGWLGLPQKDWNKSLASNAMHLHPYSPLCNFAKWIRDACALSWRLATCFCPFCGSPNYSVFV